MLIPSFHSIKSHTNPSTPLLSRVIARINVSVSQDNFSFFLLKERIISRFRDVNVKNVN